MAQKQPYVYQHYPKVVKNDLNEEIVVSDGRDHWKRARKDFEQDEIALEEFTPSAADENEQSNLLTLKTKVRTVKVPVPREIEKKEA